MKLRDHLRASAAGRTLSDPRTTIAVSDLVTGTILAGRAAELAGRSVLIAMANQLTAALAMFELDGTARRMLLCPPDLRTEHLASVIADAAIDAVVCDHPAFWRSLALQARWLEAGSRRLWNAKPVGQRRIR